MIKVIISLVITSALAISRGPHHPRKATVVKHHVHYRPSKYANPEKITQDEELLHDTSHLQVNSPSNINIIFEIFF